jgi:PadR family transcriptional regulator PadR
LANDKIPTQREAVILGILLNADRYGREIRDEYERRTRRRMPLGSLYTTLSRMEDYGFVKSWMGESTHARGGNRRKNFTITAKGCHAFDEYQAVNLAMRLESE